MQANSEVFQRYLLEEDYADVATEYCVKISAGIWSRQFNALYKSDFSDEICVDLPQVGCTPPPLELGNFILPTCLLLLFV